MKRRFEYGFLLGSWIAVTVSYIDWARFLPLDAMTKRPPATPSMKAFLCVSELQTEFEISVRIHEAA